MPSARARGNGATDSPSPPPVDNEEALSALVRAIRYADEFVLLFALCNNNALRQDMMRRLRETLSGLTVEEWRLGEPEENLYHRLADRVSAPGESSPAPDVLMVYGLEAWLSAGKEGETAAFVKNLNASRNHFPKIYAGALVLWLSSHHLEAIARGAPDFCSVRSGVYTFAAAQEERIESGRLLETLGLAGVAGLSLAEKQRRAAELERLLDEAQRQPEAERDPKRERRLIAAAAETYFTLAQYDKAEPLLGRALEIDQAAYGPEHPDVAIRLNDLARLLQATNRLGEAEPLMRRALKITQAAYGPDHREVASYLNNLAQLLQVTNRLGEAEPLMRRALEITQAAYGPDHPNVATCLNNLALLLQATNRLGEAELLIRRALEITQAAYGPDHPEVASYLNNLALLLKATNRLGEAEPLMRRALEITQVAYGPDHPMVATCLNSLASLLCATNRLGEAEPLMRRALEISQAAYGPDHPNVAIYLNNLAQLLQDTNRLGEAEPLMRRAVEILTKSLGTDHPTTRTAMENLDSLLAAK